MIMAEIVLDNAKFSDFLRVLSLLKDICNDFEIRGGILRQRSNDKANIFEMDLTPLISNSDMLISNLKQKLDLLKCFIGQDVKIESNDQEVSFSDQFSVIKFVNPRLDFMDNKYIPIEEFERIFSLRDEDLLLDYEIQSTISERMKIIAQGFNIVSFQVIFEGDNASIVAATTSKDQHAKIVTGIPVNQTLNCFSNLVTTPFIVDHDSNMNLKMYNVQETVCVNRFSASIGDVNINIFSRSQLVEEKE
jgi:hypothetical protein